MKPTPAVPPLHDWEFVAMWATAAEKHGDTYDVAVEFGRAVEARCVVAAPTAPAVPADMVMVPREPTQRMIDAADAIDPDQFWSEPLIQEDGTKHRTRDCDSVLYYRAMISSAPATPAAPAVPDLIPPDALFVCGQMGANVTRVRVEPAAPAVREPLTDAQLFNLYWDASWNADGKAAMQAYEVEQGPVVVRGLRAVLAAHGITGDKPC